MFENILMEIFISIYYIFVGIENGTPNPMPGHVKTEEMESLLVHFIDKPK